MRPWQMMCSESRPSVSLEVSGGIKWLLMNALAQSLSYYFTVHSHDENLVWLSNIFLLLSTALVFVSVHRMKLASVRSQAGYATQEDGVAGDHEWSCAVACYSMALLTFVCTLNYVDSLEMKPLEYNSLEGWCIFNRAGWHNGTRHPDSLCYSHPDEWERIPSDSRLYIYALFATTMLLNAAAYVHFVRYERKAGDNSAGF